MVLKCKLFQTGAVDISSGDYDIYISNSDTKDEDGFESDDSDYDVFIEEVSKSPVEVTQKVLYKTFREMGTVLCLSLLIMLQMKSFPNRKQSDRRSSLRSRTGTPGNTVFRMRTPPSRNISFTSTTAWTTSTTSVTMTTVASSTYTTTTTAAPSPSPSLTPWKGEEPRVYDVSCDETVCPPDSFCINDYDTGGSRCHCNLGRHGHFCSEGQTFTINTKKKT